MLATVMLRHQLRIFPDTWLLDSTLFHFMRYIDDLCLTFYNRIPSFSLYHTEYMAITKYHTVLITKLQCFPTSSFRILKFEYYLCIRWHQSNHRCLAKDDGISNENSSMNWMPWYNSSHKIRQTNQLSIHGLCFFFRYGHPLSGTNACHVMARHL